jgi:hypothetical protein
MAHIVLAIPLSGVAAAMTGCFLGEVLFHDRYRADREIWPGAASGESEAIGWSIVPGFPACGLLVLTFSSFPVQGYRAALPIALARWLVAPLPLLIPTRFSSQSIPGPGLYIRRPGWSGLSWQGFGERVLGSGRRRLAAAGD